MFVGGLRALLLQSLHPLAMAGVAQHSDYRVDPWGRLQRTADFLAATTYGTSAEAQQAVDRVHRVHVHVVGTASDGRPYSANDPHLLAWVHLAELDSFLAAHDRYGEMPLIGDERDRYVADTAVVARALGVVEPPETEGELRRQLRVFRPELRGTPEARAAARYLLLQPPLPLATRPAYGMLAGSAVALMPAWTRLPLRLPFLPITETLALRPRARRSPARSAGRCRCDRDIGVWHDPSRQSATVISTLLMTTSVFGLSPPPVATFCIVSTMSRPFTT